MVARANPGYPIQYQLIIDDPDSGTEQKLLF